MTSPKHLPASLINTALEPFGLEIRRKTKPKTTTPRNSLRGALEHIKRLGFSPSTVIDVGVASGTTAMYETFPASRHILIEPLEEFRPYLDKIVEEFPNVEYVIAAATQKPGNVTINVHPDLSGSSLFLEDEDSNVNGVPRVVPAITLDEVCQERNLDGPYLIKVDVQGAELDVLMGSSHILGDTEYVILEVSLFQFFMGGPQILDVIEFMFMKERGFVVYDIFDCQYRLLDGAMSQVDIAFVKESGQFRKFHSYASKEQREAQNERFINLLSKRLSR